MEPENKLPLLRKKFSVQIKQYGIKVVLVINGRIEVESDEKIPYELFNSIECELL
jgi:hypothetical protein